MTIIDIHINLEIIEHFLHVMYCNYIKLFMEQFEFDKKNEILDFISKKEDVDFWEQYEIFTFSNKISNLNSIILNHDIIKQINNDFMMVDIYEKNYKHYNYLVEYSSNIYYKNKEKIKTELLTYVENCVGLK